ncbi:MAG: AmmeMemoRadiSam system protein A [Synechococcales cyanobacterium]
MPTTLPELARYALEHYFATGEVAALPHIPPAWQGSQGVFVTLSLRGQMRGCWGSLTPTAPTLAEGTIRAAIGAATRDPRFPPLRRSELPHVRIQVALIRDAQPVEHLAALDPTRTGLWIRHGTQGAVLLPGEALTTQWQLARAKALAGIPPTATVELFRVDADLLREL